MFKSSWKSFIGWHMDVSILLLFEAKENGPEVQSSAQYFGPPAIVYGKVHFFKPSIKLLRPVHFSTDPNRPRFLFDELWANRRSIDACIAYSIILYNITDISDLLKQEYRLKDMQDNHCSY